MDVERLFLRPEAFYADQNIDLRLGVLVTGIDRDAKTVTLNSGEVLQYDKLALTTGSDPIPLPASIGGGLDNVYTVRTLKDADAMAAHFTKGKPALLVGGVFFVLFSSAVSSILGLYLTFF